MKVRRLYSSSWRPLAIAGCLTLACGGGDAGKQPASPPAPGSEPRPGNVTGPPVPAPAPPAPVVGGDAAPLDPQTPPMGRDAIEAWLAMGFYRSWTCEMVISRPRLNGIHGRHRICSNAALLASTEGEYPQGAASVKELFATGDQVSGYAVGLKVATGAGRQTWYWYERTGSPNSRPESDSIGNRNCFGCHGEAPRDQVYIRAAP